MTKQALVVVLAFLSFGASQAPGKEDLYGTWRLLSFKLRVVETGEVSDAYGKSPHGFLSYSRDGRMFGIVTKDVRPKPTDMAKVTDQERAELFNTMIAYAGTFTVGGNTVTHQVDISWNENWTGTDQVRNISLEGDKLHITTNPQPSGVDGKIIVADLMWEKVK